MLYHLKKTWDKFCWKQWKITKSFPTFGYHSSRFFKKQTEKDWASVQTFQSDSSQQFPTFISNTLLGTLSKGMTLLPIQKRGNILRTWKSQKEGEAFNIWWCMQILWYKLWSTTNIKTSFNHFKVPCLKMFPFSKSNKAMTSIFGI